MLEISAPSLHIHPALFILRQPYHAFLAVLELRDQPALPLPPQCWDKRCVLLHPAETSPSGINATKELST